MIHQQRCIHARLMASHSSSDQLPVEKSLCGKNSRHGRGADHGDEDHHNPNVTHVGEDDDQEHDDNQSHHNHSDEGAASPGIVRLFWRNATESIGIGDDEARLPMYRSLLFMRNFREK